ncbi:hypothetical protein M422DRAFT_46384 [Sphaerobolus stellatus SS14]|uniref:Fungal-type protein kinase domain-containing protein n=1 Tax=Sphaerobolus stellatus (strain SS14) TaxID=990650 RepID=A0A0C9VTZ7_SPHS4|nr:hypothetical protein M422DRAFT_46384 [Sphaerobolus stellatus SS14]
MAEVHYKIVHMVFRYRFLFGRGTLVYRAERDEHPDTEYVIKDAWVTNNIPGKETESSILRNIQKKGIRDGVVQLGYFEEVHLEKRLDSVQNRQISHPSVHQATSERMHTWIIMKTFGRRILDFSSP